jgi:hypothetical protein
VNFFTNNFRKAFPRPNTDYFLRPHAPFLSLSLVVSADYGCSVPETLWQNNCSGTSRDCFSPPRTGKALLSTDLPCTSEVTPLAPQDIKIGLFAPTLRQATLLMQAIFNILVSHPGFTKFRIVKRNAQSIVIFGEGSERSLTSYPSTHKAGGVLLFVCGRVGSPPVLSSRYLYHLQRRQASSSCAPRAKNRCSSACCCR